MLEGANWVHDWQLSISVEKCCVMHVGPVDKAIAFSVDGVVRNVLPVMYSCRDLGLTINQEVFL